MRKVDKMQKCGKHISKYFERPEGTHEDVAVPAAASNIKTFSMGENMLAASDVALGSGVRFSSGHRRYLF